MQELHTLQTAAGRWETPPNRVLQYRCIWLESLFLLHWAGRGEALFVRLDQAGKAVRAPGAIPQSLLLLRSSAVMPTEPEGSWAQFRNLGVWIPAALPCSFSPVTRDNCPAHTPTELISTTIQTFHCHVPFLKKNLKGSKVLYWTGYFFHTGTLFKNKVISQDATYWKIYLYCEGIENFDLRILAGLI